MGSWFSQTSLRSVDTGNNIVTWCLQSSFKTCLLCLACTSDSLFPPSVTFGSDAHGRCCLTEPVFFFQKHWRITVLCNNLCRRLLFAHGRRDVVWYFVLFLVPDVQGVGNQQRSVERKGKRGSTFSKLPESFTLKDVFDGGRCSFCAAAATHI